MNQNINYIGMVNLLRHLQNAGPCQPEGGREDCRPTPGRSRGRRHLFPLIFVTFGYGYFVEVLVLCVAEKEAISWTSRRKPVVLWR